MFITQLQCFQNKEQCNYVNASAPDGNQLL